MLMSAHELETPIRKGNLTTGHMTHSLSSLSGVDARASTPKHSGKKLAVRIQMLDDSVTLFQVQAKAIGKVLFEQVCRQLNLLEADYFGLEYQEQTTRTKYWLDLLKPLNRQVGLTLVEPLLRFCIKFYTPEPAQLEEEYTRYLFCLQIKRDLATGSLQCNDNTAALMASYIVQASCGDFVPEDYPDHTYLSSHRFVPHQDDIMQIKIMENHKKHSGQSPAEADMNLLETARRCELYGMKMHAAKDIEGVPLNLSVAHMGVAVFQGITRINIFSWAKIRKISFKRKRFLIKLHPEGYGYYKDTVEFYFDGRNECKNFWKKCVENHGFFRCASVMNLPRRKSRVLSRGSSFRYSGKTQKQIIEFVRENYVKRQNFQRSQSFRQGPLNASSRSQSHSYVNSSISANPLLPIDSAGWDSRNPYNTSTIHFLRKKSTDSWDHQKDNLTDRRHSQAIAAPVEIYQTKKYATESPILEVGHLRLSKVDMDQTSMPRSVSPLGIQSWNSTMDNKINNTKDQDQAHALLGKRNLDQSQSSLAYRNNNSLHQVSVGSQAYVTAPIQQLPTKTNTNNFIQSRTHSEDLNNSSENDQDEEEIASRNAMTSDVTESTTSQEKIFPPLAYSQHSTPVHYSITNFLTSKQNSTLNNTSIETETDNIIYTDINDLYQYKHPNEYKNATEHKISNENNLNLFNACDIYATVNRNTKSKSKINHISDEFFDQSIKKHFSSTSTNLNDNSIQTYPKYLSSNSYNETNFHKQYMNYSKELIDSFSNSSSFQENDKYNNITQSDHYNVPIETHNAYTNSLSLPKKSEITCFDSIDSYDCNYKEHETYETLQTTEKSNIKMYGSNKNLIQNNNNEMTSSINTEFSTEKYDYELSNMHEYYTSHFNQQKEKNSDWYIEKDSWLKSSSCRDLLKESEKSKPVVTLIKGFLSYNRIESPVTRYDESRSYMFSSKNHYNNNYQNFSSIIDSKVYSSSYPGSTRNNYTHHKRIYGNQLDYSGSQDDISHDSYELLEKYDHEMIDKYIRSNDNIRSCSIDSGNFIPSDDDIASGNQKYRSAMDVKCKSAADIMNEIWDSEDPRYLPREKLSVKSDGCFYKKVRETQDSQSSSQESRSEIYETKASQSSYCSKKSRDSLYHTDSKKSKSKTSIVSSNVSKESLVDDLLSRNYEMPMTTGKKVKKDSKNNQYQPHSSVESKSDYYDAQDMFESDSLSGRPRVKSIGCLLTETQGSRLKGFLCENCDQNSSDKCNKSFKVQSISLQNVEIEKSGKSFASRSPDIINFNKNQETNNSISTIPLNEKYIKSHDKECQTMVALRRKSDSENIFSFDRDKIESFTSSCKQSDKLDSDEKNKNSPDYPLTPELLSEFDKQVKVPKTKKKTRKEELMAKTHFEEYNPKISNQTTQLTNVLAPLTYSHATVERTKSDPNSLAKRSSLCKNQRRHVLMHQKSIDLTPADSSDEEYFYKQIPSAPPQCKAFGNFELPKSTNMIATPVEVSKTGFETPKSFFNEFDYRSSKVLKEDIPYILHKRHVMSDMISSPIEKKNQKTKSPRSPKSPKSPVAQNNDKKGSNKNMPEILENVLPEMRQDFLFTQNIDLSKIDPITLEIDKSKAINELLTIGSAKTMDRMLFEKLNQKLGRIENNSGTSSKPDIIFKDHPNKSMLPQVFDKEILLANKFTVAKRIISKSRTVNKPRKSKTRITSFSSDDESLDSDDVFGSTEPIPSTLEFSPPQSRKEIEPILRIEQSKLISAAWGRGQTMSSTEIEGSPPQCRRLAELESRYDKVRIESAVHSNTTELRRISERSISIPSSEEENYVSSKGICITSEAYERTENIPAPYISPAYSTDNKEEIFATHKNGETINYTLKKNDTQKALEKGIAEPVVVSVPKESVAVLLPQACLNLSEGSATIKQSKSCLEFPLIDRRAKSLDISVLAVHKLPPLNAFSTKDDTIEFEEEDDVLEQKELHQKANVMEEEMPDSVRSCLGSIPSAQVCKKSLKSDPILSTVNIDFEENDLLHQLAFIEKIALKGVKIKDRKKSKMQLRSGDHLILDIPKYNFDYSPLNSCNSSRKTSPGVSRASSLENSGLRKSKIRSKSSELMKLNQNIGTTVSPKTEKKSTSKEPERRLSKEKSKSQEETKADIAKRKERQQKLYESAMKQTITMLSPVMDKLPPFPTPEDKISVKTEGDKIIIETDFKSRAKDHVLIAKSPRKLDTSLVKFSRSFDEGGCIKKLEKANRSFEDRKKSFEDSEKSDTASDAAIESPKTTLRNQSFEENTNKDLNVTNVDKKSDTKTSASDENKSNTIISLSSHTAARREEKVEKSKRSVVDRKIFANHYYINEEIDMQAVISERRSLEILKRQSPRSEDTARDSDGSHMHSTGDSVDSYVSIDESTSDSKRSFTAEEGPHRVPTIECEEASLEDDGNSNECRQLKVSRFSNYHLSLDRSRSDETGSWMTVDCEEYIGSDISDNEVRTHEPQNETLVKQATSEDAGDLNITTSPCTSTSDQNVQIVVDKNEELKKLVETSSETQIDNSDSNARLKEKFSLQSDKSKSSDSCTSGEGIISSPKLGAERYDWSLSVSGKEKSSIEDESSVSCSIARPLGISQDFGELDNKKCLELKEQMLKLDTERSGGSDKSPTQNKKASAFVLEKQSPVDFGTSTELFQDEPEEANTDILPKDEENKSLKTIPFIFKPVRKKNSNLSGPEQGSIFLKSGSDQSSQESKSSFDSKTSLSIESKGSFETESSSGSLGQAQRRGELLQKEQQSTWKPFTIESSGSSSLEEQFQNFGDESFDLTNHAMMLNTACENDLLDSQKGNDLQYQNELMDFPTTFGYPIMTSSLSGIGTNPTDIIGYNTGFSTGRTLSRISERSTASEKSSIEDDVSKASTHSMSMRDESAGSTDHQPSLSSDSRSNTNLAYISDADRRTSAEMPDIPCDSATGERLSSISTLNDQKPSTVITGRFAVTQVDEQAPEEFDKHTLLSLSNPGSQDSEDWPLPEIPYDFVPVKPTELMFVVPDLDKPVPKTFYWKSSKSFQSDESQEWPTPSSNVQDLPEDENQTFTPEFEDNTETATPENPHYQLQDLPYGITSSTSPTEDTKVLPYADTSYFMSSFNKDETCFSKGEYNSPTCLSTVQFLPYAFKDSCCSAFKSVPEGSLLKEHISDAIINLQPTRSPKNLSPISAEESNSNDDVFFPGTTKFQLSPDEHSRKHTNNSDTSVDDVLSFSGATVHEEQVTVRRSFDRRASCQKKCSHSSHSEEETSSICTDLDGTVRMGLQLQKCTHSSHSEDTSIGLSISEWSTGTNTVHQYANLSGSDSLSAVSNHSFGVKSEKSNQPKSNVNSFNKSSESLNGKSVNFSGTKKFSVESSSSDGLRYDTLSNSETDKFSDSLTKSDNSTLTLTEMAQSNTDWSTSSSRTLVTAQPQTSQTQERKSRRNSGIEYVPLKNPRDIKNVVSLENKKTPFPLVHNNKNSPPLEMDNLQSDEVLYDDGNIRTWESSKLKDFKPAPVIDTNEGHKHFPESVSSRRKHSFEIMSKKYQSQELPSDGEEFPEYLYPPTEKLSALYQSQEFIPIHQSPTEPKSSSITNQERSPQPEKSYLNPYSYEYKTSCADKSKESKTKKLRHSHSFNEQFDSDTESIMPPFPPTPPQIVKDIFSNRLSPEAITNVVYKGTVRKGSLTQSSQMKIIQSGNDTDDAQDFVKKDFEVKCVGYRKKRFMPKKRTRADPSHKEQDDMIFSEDDRSKHDMAINPCAQFQEEQLQIELDDCASNVPYPNKEFSGDYIDDFIRSQQTLSRTSQSRIHTYNPLTPPKKPTREKKRQSNCDESLDTANEHPE